MSFDPKKAPCFFQDIEFPTVTICGSGQYLEQVEEALYRKFALTLSGFMIWKTLSDWQARQVVTTLNTLTKSIEGKMNIPRDVVIY